MVAVDVLRPVPVKGVEGFDDGETGGLDAARGGAFCSGVGFAGGTDRLVMVLEERGKRPEPDRLDLFLASIGDAGRRGAFDLTERLRRAGLSVELDHRDRGLRKQLSEANRLGARYLLVIGEDEAASGTGNLKEMDSGEEREVALTVDALVNAVQGG